MHTVRIPLSPATAQSLNAIKQAAFQDEVECLIQDNLLGVDLSKTTIGPDHIVIASSQPQLAQHIDNLTEELDNLAKYSHTF